MGSQTIVLVLGLVWAAAPGMAAKDLGGHGRSGEDPTALVQQLGDRRFALRRAATARLIELGVQSVEALEDGVESEDREIRFRSRHVLAIVRQADFQHRLQAFAAGTGPPENCDLPGWSRCLCRGL